MSLTNERDKVLEFLRSFIAGGVNQDFKPWARELYAKLYNSADETAQSSELIGALEVAKERLRGMGWPISAVAVGDAIERLSGSHEPVAAQAPILHVIVSPTGVIALTKWYAPGLPPGEHDLYCEPMSVAPASKSNVCPKGHTDADGDCSSTCYAENAGGACPVGVPLNPLRAVEHTGSSPDEVTGPHNCAQSLGLDPKDVFLG